MKGHVSVEYPLRSFFPSSLVCRWSCNIFSSFSFAPCDNFFCLFAWDESFCVSTSGAVFSASSLEFRLCHVLWVSAVRVQYFPPNERLKFQSKEGEKPIWVRLMCAKKQTSNAATRFFVIATKQDWLNAAASNFSFATFFYYSFCRLFRGDAMSSNFMYCMHIDTDRRGFFLSSILTMQLALVDVWVVLICRE